MKGGGRVFQRGRRWWLAVYFRGEEIRKSAGRTREAAREKLKATRAELAGEDSWPRENTVTVTDLLDSYETDLERRKRKSLTPFRSHAKSLRRLLGRHIAAEVSTFDIERYQRKRRASGKATATVDRETEILRGAYRLAQKRGLIKLVPYFPFFPSREPAHRLF